MPTGPACASPRQPHNDITEHDTHDVYPVLQRMRRQRSTAPIVNRADAPLVTRFADLDSGLADVVTVGAAALATPDLPHRIRTGAPLNEPDPVTFYGGDHRGYTYYPVLTTTSAS